MLTVIFPIPLWTSPKSPPLVRTVNESTVFFLNQRRGTNGSANFTFGGALARGRHGDDANLAPGTASELHPRDTFSTNKTHKYRQT